MNENEQRQSLNVSDAPFQDGAVTRSGRVITRPSGFKDFDPSVLAVVTTTQLLEHTTKPRTHHQRQN